MNTARTHVRAWAHAGLSLVLAWTSVARADDARQRRDDEEKALRIGTARVENVEDALKSGNIQTVFTSHWDAYKYSFLLAAELLPENKPKAVALQKRLVAADQQLAAKLGGRVAVVLADGQRTQHIDARGIEQAEKLIDLCAGNRDKYLKLYDKLKQSSPDVLRFAGMYGSDGSVTWAEASQHGAKNVDVPMSLAECERKVAGEAANADDTYRDEKAVDVKPTSGCGYSEVGLKALKTGRGFAPYEAMNMPETTFAVPCAKLPVRHKAPADVLKAARSELSLAPGDVVVMENTTVERDGLDLYKYAYLRIYSRKTQLMPSKCGDQDPKVVCEANSTTVDKLDRIRFYLARAAARHKEGDVKRCTELLKSASQNAADFAAFSKEAKDEHRWTAGLKYKTRYDGQLAEKAILGELEQLRHTVESHTDDDWCRSPADGKDDQWSKLP